MKIEYCDRLPKKYKEKLRNVINTLCDMYNEIAKDSMQLSNELLECEVDELNGKIEKYEQLRSLQKTLDYLHDIAITIGNLE